VISATCWLGFAALGSPLGTKRRAPCHGSKRELQSENASRSRLANGRWSTTTADCESAEPSTDS
jgi:hypothetical protein